MEEISKVGILEAFELILEYLPMFFDEDVALGLSDREKYLKVIASDTVPIKLNKGDSIPKEGAVFQALSTGKMMVREVPKEVYGVPFKSYAIPLVDSKSKEIVGVVVAGKSLERKNEITTLSQNLSSSLQEISLEVQRISEEVQNVISSNEDIFDEINMARENSKGTDEILKFIQNISNQTNLLGLNAAIESSRAGEFGKGFEVVAKEIRKLASSSNDSVKRVDEVLKKIDKSVLNISQKVNETNMSVESQGASLEELTATIEELSSIANVLDELAKKI